MFAAAMAAAVTAEAMAAGVMAAGVMAAAPRQRSTGYGKHDQSQEGRHYFHVTLLRSTPPLRTG